MRSVLLALALCFVTTSCAHQEMGEAHPNMRMYYMVLLRRGPAWTPQQTPEVNRILTAHIKNIRRLHDMGKVVIAGPFETEGNDAKDALAGIYVPDAVSRDEANKLAQSDPAVQSGRLSAEVLPWWGAKSLLSLE